MDKFVMSFFPDLQAAGAPFTGTRDGLQYTYLSGHLKVDIVGQTNLRKMIATQPMTALGLMDAIVAPCTSSLDGVNKLLLTPEGVFNPLAVGEILKNQRGIASVVASQQVQMAQTKHWADNHVALLVNMLRFCFLRMITLPSGNLNGCFDQFTQGGKSLDPNQWFGAAYPAEGEWAWPGGAARDSYPNYVRLLEETCSDWVNAVDLTGLSNNEAAFVLTMLGAWNRRSRYRLDFSLPKLAESCAYRHSADLGAIIDNWYDETAPGSKTNPPELPSGIGAWRIIQKYVTQNNLYGHFSTAMYLISAATYQMVPQTLEGHWWYGVNWQLSIPAFKSIRGRYKFINEGEAALLSERALKEWSYVNGSIEKINLMALIYPQAYQTGMAVRATRRGLETDPADLNATHASFYRRENFASAAADEAVRFDTPLSGMPGAYLYAREVRETPFAGYEIILSRLYPTGDDDDRDYGTKTITVRKPPAKRPTYSEKVSGTDKEPQPEGVTPEAVIIEDADNESQVEGDDAAEKRREKGKNVDPSGDVGKGSRNDTPPHRKQSKQPGIKINEPQANKPTQKSAGLSVAQRLAERNKKKAEEQRARKQAEVAAKLAEAEAKRREEERKKRESEETEEEKKKRLEAEAAAEAARKITAELARKKNNDGNKDSNEPGSTSGSNLPPPPPPNENERWADMGDGDGDGNDSGEEVEEERSTVIVKRVPIAGAPVLIMPLQCFPYTSPFSLGGTFDKTQVGRQLAKGWQVPWYKLWELANFYRLCGYELDWAGSVSGIDGPIYHESNDEVEFSWPVTADRDTLECLPVALGMIDLEENLVDIPPIHHAYFRDKVDYKIEVTSRGFALRPGEDLQPVWNMSAPVKAFANVTLDIKVPEGIKRLQGYISRSETGFRYAEYAPGGVIPSATEPTQHLPHAAPRTIATPLQNTGAINPNVGSSVPVPL